MKDFLQKYYGPLALLVLILAEMTLFSGIRIVGHWFYILAWWPYIFFVDWLVKRKTGNSLIIDRTKEFLVLIPWSTFLWLIFEWFNLYLKNWHYINIISSLPLRWLGYFFSFGTVLPGLFETYELLFSYGVLKNYRIRPLRDPRSLYHWFILIGGLFLVLPLAYPRYFFPFVWGSFIFLLEPINHLLGAPSILREWESGSLTKFLLLLLAGLICGLLWEFWNFWAESKWIYTVPFVGNIKLFEMPILGFLGFPPFAVECYVMVSFISLFRKGSHWETKVKVCGRGATKKLVILAIFIHLFFDIFMFQQIDSHTVKSFISHQALDKPFALPTSSEPRPPLFQL